MSDGAPRVALTFDAEHPDRPRCDPDGAERVLDVLREADVRATFFVQGRWAMSRPETAHRVAADGHLVGHHSHYHVRMRLLSDEGLREDVAQGEGAILETIGEDPHPWFRLPFGDGHDDPRVLGTLEDLGFRNVHWDVELEDWEPWRSAPEIAEDAVAGALAHGDGAIVLLHTWPVATAEALPSILTRLADAGVRPVRLDELEPVR